MSILSSITSQEVIDAIPVIISLIVIEGLLSVDNALAIAAMAKHLPGKQKFLALRLGIIGAYVFRGIAMAFAAYIIANPWLKIVGALYLVYLMCQHFTDADTEDSNGKKITHAGRGLVATIMAIEVMDISLSVDNVVAAVAMSPKLWVVCTGVFIGIIALRFVAGWCVRLIEKYPILGETAFLLIGYVGFILVYELLCDPHSGFQCFPGPVHVSSTRKFIGIILILTLSIMYSKSNAAQSGLKPVFAVLAWPMRLVTLTVGGVIKIALLPFKLLIGLFQKKPTQQT